MTVKTLTLQAVIQELDIGIEVTGVLGVHHINLAHCVTQTGGFKFLLHVVFTTDNQRLAKARTLIGDRCAQHAGIVALGKDHTCLSIPRTGVQTAQDRNRRVHPRLQAFLVAIHVDDRTACHAGVHPRLGNRRRDAVDQTRVERCRNDVVTAKRQLAAIGHRHLVRHIFARHFRQRLGTGDLHFVVDGPGVDIQRATEQVREAQHVVDLVRIIRTARGDNCVGAHGVTLFRGNLGIGVRHGKDHRIVIHRSNHCRGHRPLGRHAKENVSALHGLFQRAKVGFHRMGRFPLVHAFGATLIDHALGVTSDAVVVLRAHGFQQFDTSDPRSARAIQHDLAVFDLLARDMQRVDQTGGADHGGAVLVVVEHRNIHLLFQGLFDDETLGRLDVLKVDATKGRTHQLHRLDEFIRVFSVEFDVDRVHICKAFEQNRLTFHHRLGAQRAKVAQTQNRGPVRDHRNKVALVGIVIGGRRVFGDGFTGNRHTRRIGQRQVALGRHRHARLNLELAGSRLQMERERLFRGDFGLGHSCDSSDVFRAS